AARPVEAGNNAELNWIATDREDNGNCLCRGLSGESRHSAPGRHEHCHLAGYEIGSECGESIVAPFRPAKFDGHVATFNIAAFTQSLTKCRQEVCPGAGRHAAEESDHRHWRLLRARRERPGQRRAAPECDEVTPCHAKPIRRRQTLPKGSILRHSKIAHQCRSWVSLGHGAMSAQCSVCPTADIAGRFMSTRPSLARPLSHRLLEGRAERMRRIDA